MDPSIYNYPPPNLLLQQSKLATYMNLNSSTLPSTLPSSLPSTSQAADNELTETPELNAEEPTEFIPSMYYASTSSPPTTPPQDVFANEACMMPNLMQVHQENVGGTTYFFSTNTEAVAGSSQSMGVSHMPHHMYADVPSHLQSSAIKPGLTSSYQLRDSLRNELIMKNQLLNTPIDLPCMNVLPMSVEQYVDLVPLDDSDCDGSSSTYRVTHRQTGLLYAMRRLHDFNFAFTKLPFIIEQWKKLNHPNLVQLREVFSTKVFGDQSLVFIYDYYPESVTLFNKFMLTNRVSLEDVDPFNADPDAPRPYTHQKNTILRIAHGGTFMAESTIWNILVQITAALRVIHSAGLSCWYLDPSNIIVKGTTVRITWGGINEIIKVASCGSAGLQMTTEDAQQEDLNALGRIILGLICQSNLPLDPRVVNLYMQTVTRDYSTDLKNLVMYLLGSPSKSRSLIDVMPMIGARFYSFTETLQRRIDALEDILCLELDNGRLYRLLVKLNTVVDRPELNVDHSWAETGDRYILKLFRDYLFHCVTPEGRPWLDNAHIVHCLNEMDYATQNKIQLISRNEQSVLIVSFSELNVSLERAFNEVLDASNA